MIDATLQAALENLSRALGLPVSTVIKDAVRQYLASRQRTINDDLDAAYANLEAYRERDPDFEQAIAMFAKAEASIEVDPFEGQPVSKTNSAIRAEIQQLLNGRLGL